MNDKTFLFAYEGPEEERLDRVIAAELEMYSRSRIQDLIAEGQVQVNETVIFKKSEPVIPGDEIFIQVPAAEESDLIPQDIPLDVIYENEDLLVVNKPAGMVVHPSLGHETGTLVNAVLAHAPEIEGVGGIRRPGIVHRLDKGTSGVILVAKNDRAHQFLQEQFQERTVEKEYRALVDGHPPTPKGRIEVAIGRDPHHRQRMAPVLPQDGKEAVSQYYTISTFPKHTYLKVLILTGRTHQIRVHLSFLECPVVGDTRYGQKRPSLPLDRPFLHAARVTIRVPGESDPRTFEAPLPPALETILQELKQQGT
jgi:23S rRNA pseudouridine1911/1915/1917 synthase